MAIFAATQWRHAGTPMKRENRRERIGQRKLLNRSFGFPTTRWDRNKIPVWIKIFSSPGK